MRYNTVLFFFLLFSTALAAQKKHISPGDPSLNTIVLKDQTIFQKLSWLDKDGNIKKEATLNLITRIDSIKHTLTYLQVRNDGKKDSSVCEFPGLKPIYVSSVSSGNSLYYDYRGGRSVKIHMESTGKPVYDTVFTMPRDYFDAFLSEYILGALPIENSVPLQFDIYRNDIKKEGTWEIANINKDVFLSASRQYIPVYVLRMAAGTLEYLVYIDAKTRQVLKTVFPLPDGGYFVKSLI